MFPNCCSVVLLYQKDDDFEARPEVRRSLLLDQPPSSKSRVAALAKHKEGKETQNNGGLLRSGSSRLTSRLEKEQDRLYEDWAGCIHEGKQKTNKFQQTPWKFKGTQ